jgi:O-antigen/teichoic acid export membrane protein
MIASLIAWLDRILERVVKNDLLRRVIKNSTFLLSAKGASIALGMVQGILVPILLGVTALGVLGTITTFTTTVKRLISFRMNELVVKYVGQFEESGDPKRAAAVFKAASLTEALSSLFIYALIFALAPLAAKIFAKDIATESLFVIYGLLVFTQFMDESARGLLQVFDRFGQIALIDTLQSAVSLVLVVPIYVYYQLLDHPGSPLLAVVLAYLIGKAVGVLGQTILALRQAGQAWGKDWWRSSLSLLQGQYGELLRFGVSTNLSGSLSLITKDSEMLWVSFLRSPTEAGYYRLALTMINWVQLPVDPLSKVTFPEVARQVARRSWETVRSLLKQASLVAGGYTLLVALGALLFGHPLINLVYGEEFLPAYPALMILLVGYLVANAFFWNRITLLSIGKPEFPTQVNFVLAVLKVVAMLTLVPVYGYLVNAALLAGSYVLGVSANVLKFRHELRSREAAVDTG